MRNIKGASLRASLTHFWAAPPIGNATDPGFLFKTGKSANVFGYSGGVMDLRIDSLAMAGDSDLSSEAKKFTKAFSECAPAAGLYFKTMYVAVKKDLVIPAASRPAFSSRHIHGI